MNYSTVMYPMIYNMKFLIISDKKVIFYFLNFLIYNTIYWYIEFNFIYHNDTLKGGYLCQIVDIKEQIIRHL